jgi:hypothetical protein
MTRISLLAVALFLGAFSLGFIAPGGAEAMTSVPKPAITNAVDANVQPAHWRKHRHRHYGYRYGYRHRPLLGFGIFPHAYICIGC